VRFFVRFSNAEGQLKTHVDRHGRDARMAIKAQAGIAFLGLVVEPAELDS
jgi:hypothetical protein